MITVSVTSRYFGKTAGTPNLVWVLDVQHFDIKKVQLSIIEHILDHFYTLVEACVLVAQKNPLIETDLLSTCTHNICFG